MIARGLNRAGVERFRAYLAGLRAGATGGPPEDLLEDARYSSELPVDLIVEPRRFISRYHVAVYLTKALAALAPAEADSEEGLWSWLSLYWFDSLCPRRADGTRRPGSDSRHIASFERRSRYRHLLYGPYLVYRRHGAVSEVLLTGRAHVESTVYHAITDVQDLIANPGVLEVVSLLYFDPRTRGLKRGSQTSRPRPGAVRRLVRVLQQLDVTHDVYGMSGVEIASLLPAEFDAWRERAPESLPLTPA